MDFEISDTTLRGSALAAVLLAIVVVHLRRRTAGQTAPVDDPPLVASPPHLLPAEEAPEALTDEVSATAETVILVPTRTC